MVSINDRPEHLETDFLVIGAGVAGMRAAIDLAPFGRVLVVAKDTLEESSSTYAQGGIAVALSDDDQVSLHEADTLAAGDGLCSPEAVHALVEEGPARIQELIEWGVEFDRDGPKLLFAREGAHSRSRVLHAHGDSTGREIARTLYHKAVSVPGITFLSFSAVSDLLLDTHGAVAGALALDERNARRVELRARAVLLATGGLGRVFQDTTNPDVATGDGVAMAWRAGAAVSDLEFVQFHPTALHIPGAPRFLLSEALRGEGARLLNLRGERFMERYHPLGDLAPRDVVARSIVAEMERDGAPHVLLDLSGRGPDFVKNRFPRIHSTCLAYGIDLDRQPGPVLPAAHYAMGGVATGLDGQTTVPGLYAAGEVACTGVHGANRLASNSLLEGLVYGARAGLAMGRETRALRPGTPPPPFVVTGITEAELRSLTWRRAGLLRCAEGLNEALHRLAQSGQDPRPPAGRAEAELRNIHQVAQLMARSALAREESRGAHRRRDFPNPWPGPARHSWLTPGSEVEFR
ncbi:MAG: L-aspartate oxidase [Bryobacteraceae bacterium]|nr:L-aspartate oxidase [Solibacteraceae bacterium]MCO5350602.1 L-aspartate oxidase [Bryobacteraceae bacterium]